MKSNETSHNRAVGNWTLGLSKIILNWFKKYKNIIFFIRVLGFHSWGTFKPELKNITIFMKISICRIVFDMIYPINIPKISNLIFNLNKYSRIIVRYKTSYYDSDAVQNENDWLIVRWGNIWIYTKNIDALSYISIGYGIK